MVLISNPKVIAHRGASGSVPENTTLAVLTAMVSQADMVEIDVQLTQDGQVVLFHDRDLQRIADSSKSVQELPAKDLRDIDVGSWKSSAFSHLRVPFLQDILELTMGYSMIVEIKPNKEVHDQPRQLETLVLELLDNSDGIGSGYISVRDEITYQWFKDHNSKYRIGLMQKKRSCQELFELVGQYGVNIIQIRSNQFTHKYYQQLPPLNTENYVYWGNSPREWDYLSQEPIHGILTNYPAIMKAHFLDVKDPSVLWS